MVVVATIKVKKGLEEKVETAFLNMIKKVAPEKGTLVYTLHRSMENPLTYLFYEKYKDKEAFSFHSSTPYFKALFEELDGCFDGAPGIEMFTELAGI